jgi:hypothetical protein
MTKIKVRKTWVINPKTRVVPSKKIYKRQKAKKQLARVIRDEPRSSDESGDVD